MRSQMRNKSYKVHNDRKNMPSLIQIDTKSGLKDP